MKKLLIILFILIFNIIKSQVPCPNDNSFWIDLTPTGLGNTKTSTCTYAGDYNTFTACLGVNYSITVCGSTYNSAVTMYSNSGTLLYSQNNITGNGCETFTWTSTINGVVKLLVDKFNCGTNSICTTVSITQLSTCGGSPTSNVNCNNAISLCTDMSFSGNSSGYGTQELNSSNQGCLSLEHQSSWYSFTAASTGTISLTITTTADYDFAIWGPNVSCGALGSPIRCSFAAGSGNTGLANSATDLTESAFGDKWVAPLIVTTGQTYILLLDNYSADLTSFTLDWTMSGGASLNCSILPIELIYFNGYNDNDINVLNWITLTEINNKGFDIERSTDGINWKKIGYVNGNGTSNVKHNYTFYDNTFINFINYYRLKQIDFDNTENLSNIIDITSIINNNENVYKITNLLGQEVSNTYNGPIILYYNNGKTKYFLNTK